MTFIVNELGPWFWLIAGFLCLSIEIFYARGVFLASGLAALALATLLITPFWLVTFAWPVQVALFLALTAGFFFAVRRVVSSQWPERE